MNPLQSHSDALTGIWHLLGEADDEITVPLHRVDFLFKLDRQQLTGAVLNRMTGEEMPLAEVSFDGSILQLQMQAQEGTEQTSMPTLVMRAGKDKFEGQWRKADGEVFAPKLKLIRAQETTSS